MNTYKVGEIIKGKVKDVKPYAIFFTFDNGTSGLLHISEISDGFVKDIEKFASIDDEINVKVISVDKRNGFLRLSLKQVPEEEKYSTHKNQKRHIISTSEEDFAPLKDKLEEWINDSMKGFKNND